MPALEWQRQKDHPWGLMAHQCLKKKMNNNIKRHKSQPLSSIGAHICMHTHTGQQTNKNKQMKRKQARALGKLCRNCKWS